MCVCLVFIDFVSSVIAFAREVGALTKIEPKKSEQKCHVLLSKVKCMGHDTAVRATPMQNVLRVVFVHVCVRAQRRVCRCSLRENTNLNNSVRVRMRMRVCVGVCVCVWQEGERKRKRRSDVKSFD
jgi:hypothetical protein